MNCAGKQLVHVEHLEPRRLFSISIDPISAPPLNEGDSRAYEFSIQQSPPTRHRYRISYGDGAEYTSGDFDSTVTSFVAPSHLFRDNGPGTSQAFNGLITVWSLDNNGNVIEQASRPFEQVVANLAPAIGEQPLAPRTVIEGQGLTFQYLQIDRGLDDAIDVTVNWGDGDITTTPATRVDRPDFGFDAFPTKPSPYAYAGEYPITVTSVDDDGGTLVEQSVVTVRRRFSLIGAASVLADSQYTLELRTTNPDVAQVNFLIDWGDGTSPQPFGATMSVSMPAFVTHTFAGPVSLAAKIVATPSEGSTNYPSTSKFVDVLGTLPAAPTLFGVEVSSNTTIDMPYTGLRQVRISWNSVVPQRIDTFAIERSSDGQTGWQVIVPSISPDIAGTTSFTDTSATQTQFYRVRAQYNGNFSGYSPTFAARMAEDQGLELSATVLQNPNRIALAWTPADAATVGFAVYRKNASEPSWSLLDELTSAQNSFTDFYAVVGTAYEYRVDRLNTPGATTTAEDIDRAFILSGIARPLPNNDARRGAILVIDQTAHADAAVASAIDQLKRDLVGERYEVRLLFVEPSDEPRAAHEIRDRIAQLSRAMSSPTVAILLIGHVPAPFSGRGAYDFHSDHEGAWSTDVFYGDLRAQRDGPGWTDLETIEANRRANNNLPGDGKFDNDKVPDRIEAAVGRIDFFEPGRARFLEFADIANYLQKAHRYRTGQTAFTRDAVMDVRLPRGHSPRAAPQYTMYEGLVGRAATTTRNWRVAFEEPLPHQFASAVGAGAWDRIFDPNNADAIDGNMVSPFHPYSLNALFIQTTGSLFGDFYALEEDVNLQNMLRYPLRSGAVLTNVYVESAQFEMHGFGLGETIGDAWLRNINSTGEYDRNHSSMPGSITLSLMGDPTLSMYPVQPVTNLTATVNKSNAVQLTWTGGSASYRVYRAASIEGAFEFVGQTDQQTFIDPSPGPNNLYMVRAIDLIESRSGTFTAASTGVFVGAVNRLIPITASQTVPVSTSPLSVRTARNAMRELEEWMDNAGNESDDDVL